MWAKHVALAFVLCVIALAGSATARTVESFDFGYRFHLGEIGVSFWEEPSVCGGVRGGFQGICA